MGISRSVPLRRCIQLQQQYAKIQCPDVKALQAFQKHAA